MDTSPDLSCTNFTTSAALLQTSYVANASHFQKLVEEASERQLLHRFATSFIALAQRRDVPSFSIVFLCLTTCCMVAIVAFSLALQRRRAEDEDEGAPPPSQKVTFGGDGHQQQRFAAMSPAPSVSSVRNVPKLSLPSQADHHGNNFVTPRPANWNINTPTPSSAVSLGDESVSSSDVTHSVPGTHASLGEANRGSRAGGETARSTLQNVLGE
eukprot:TRINITY_DN58295_c0_g1_i1.p1 TRINITY_DN58295_c0_g1~~TRINITY_DN58295_c0_g1_i1.p1  ORF type:complete len:213 (-),score=29.78 TRINITY_DN58295_c0_g1_i1:143-781(-)